MYTNIPTKTYSGEDYYYGSHSDSDLEYGKFEHLAAEDFISNSSLDFLSDTLTNLASFQIGLSIVGFILSVATLTGFTTVSFSIYLIARLVTLFVVGIGCRHIFDPSDSFQPRPNLTFIGLYLQALWLFAEVILGFSPPIIVVAHIRQVFVGYPWIGSLLVGPAPALIMVGLATVKTYWCRLKQRRNSRRMEGSSPSSPLSQASYGLSSNYSGESSPTGVLSPRIPHHSAQLADDVTLVEHEVETGLERSESVLFVHKTLSPIKTRPTPHPPQHSYVPFLGPLIKDASSKLAVNNKKANHAHPGLKAKSWHGKPVVHATVSIAPPGGKGHQVARLPVSRNNSTGHESCIMLPAVQHATYV